jgi:hypothetical protein
LDSDQTKLERLELSRCVLDRENFSFIIQGLITNRTVRALIIRRCKIARDATHLLPTLLKSKNTTMTHLEITEPQGWCSCAASNAILAAPVRNTVLTTLLLQGFAADTKSLVNFVARNRSVTHF